MICLRLIANIFQKLDGEEEAMSSVVLEIVKTVGIESAVFGIGNIAQSFSTGNNIVSLAFLGVGAIVTGKQIGRAHV